MSEPNPRPPTWLDRVAAHFPGYGGYQEQANRRAADRVLRDALARRLGGVHRRLDEAIRQCVDRGALTEVNALERLAQHVDRIVERLHSAGSGTDAFYGTHNLELAKADPLHAFDHELFQDVVQLEERFDHPATGHDFLAGIASDLAGLEMKLDQRALLMQGLST